MFIYSLNAKKVKKTSIVLVVTTLIIGCSSIIFYKCNKHPDLNYESNITVNNSVENTDAMLKFISQFGYGVKNEPDEIKEVVIPFDFDEVYLNYNELQKQQGYDLSEFKGKKVKKWMFTITDYPKYENTEYIKINILVYDGRVIGGDVCSVKSDGFMHGFEKEYNNDNRTS